MSPGDVRFGVYAKPQAGQTQLSAVTDLEHRIGRTFDLRRGFYRWGEVFPGPPEFDDQLRGRATYLTLWPGTPSGLHMSWESIARGDHDAYLTARAHALRDLERRVLFAFNHEPENDQKEFGSPEQFVAAYRHVRRVFLDQGATNVRFVWHIMAKSATEDRLGLWWPGREHVDVVAASGYNKALAGWKSLRVIFRDVYEFAVARDLPFMIGETGSVEHPDKPDAKARWLLNAATTLAGWTRAMAFCYYHSDRHYPYWVDTSDQSFEAYKLISSQAPFARRPP
jgi:hypothetical protein